VRVGGLVGLGGYLFVPTQSSAKPDGRGHLRVISLYVYTSYTVVHIIEDLT
jgi:hypothetical protein